MFSKNITLGIPMTTMSGGMSPDNKVILNPRNTIVASEASIPMIITIKAKKTTLKDLKKNNRIRDVTNIAKPRNMINSFVTWEVYSVRINGIPE